MELCGPPGACLSTERLIEGLYTDVSLITGIISTSILSFEGHS